MASWVSQKDRIKNENPLREQGVSTTDVTSCKRNFTDPFKYYKHKNKLYPPYGKKLMLQRQVGQIPSKIVMIVFNWYLARAYPRIVITEDMSPENMEFSFLSGIPAQVVYNNENAYRVDVVVQEILKVNPSFLSTFALGLVDTGKAITIIKPLEESRVEVLCA